MKPFFIHLSYSILVTFMIASSSASQSSIKNDNALLDTLSVKDDFMRYFESCGVEGSIVIFDNNKKKWIVSDTTTIYSETLPASTFKIINLLIALETGVIASENDTIKWPGKTDTVKYGYRPEIYFDMTIKEAFEVSAGWVFNELSQKIGKENYNHYLKICNYGNQNITEPGDDYRTNQRLYDTGKNGLDSGRRNQYRMVGWLCGNQTRRLVFCNAPFAEP